jgi:hypothetical protein
VPEALGSLLAAYPPLKRWAFLFRPAKRDCFSVLPMAAPSAVVMPMSNARLASNLVHCGCCAVPEATDTASCIIRHRQTHARSGMMDLNAGSAEAVCAEAEMHHPYNDLDMVLRELTFE